MISSPGPRTSFRSASTVSAGWKSIKYPDGTTETFRHYRAPDAKDLQREEKVFELLRERFHDWQKKGYLPSRRIEPGDETDKAPT